MLIVSFTELQPHRDQAIDRCGTSYKSHPTPHESHLRLPTHQLCGELLRYQSFWGRVHVRPILDRVHGRASSERRSSVCVWSL
jgi:hypothetical protein